MQDKESKEEIFFNFNAHQKKFYICLMPNQDNGEKDGCEQPDIFGNHRFTIRRELNELISYQDTN